MSHRNKPNTTKPSLLDIALLTAGSVNEKVFSACIDAIISEAHGSNIFVYKHGCPFAYPEILKRLPENSRVVSSSGNADGFPEGANRVIRMGKAPLVLFVTDDVILTPGTVDVLLRRMDDPTIAQCGLKLLFPPDSSLPGRPAGKVQHVGLGMNINGEVVHPLVGWSADNPRCCISREVFAVTGACFIVRRKAFERAGKFNPVYAPGYFEDVELSINIRNLGGKVFIDTDAIATHVTGATFSQSEKQPPSGTMQKNKDVFGMRNSQYFIWTDWQMW